MIKLIENRIVKKQPVKEAEKLVIYKGLSGYEVTPKSNYEARVQNARAIKHLDDFNSAQEVIDYYKKYGWADEEDFEIIDESNAITESEDNHAELIIAIEELLDGAKYSTDWTIKDNKPSFLNSETQELIQFDNWSAAQYFVDHYYDEDEVIESTEIEESAEYNPSEVDRSQLEESIWGDYEPYDKTEGWTDEDIELHKSIDWAARDYKDYPVEDDMAFRGVVICYGAEPGKEKEIAKFIKYLRSNPIYPPYYAPETEPFDFPCVGPMYDGDRMAGYDIHNRYETQEIYDALSR